MAKPLPAGYTFETMSPADYDDVYRLWQQTEGVGLNESDSRDAIAQYLARNPDLSLVARCGSTIVATILCGQDGRRGYLYHLAVASAHRRHGLGKCLVDSCLARLEKLGISRCNAYVFADNTDGTGFWRKQGWTTRTNLHLLQKTLTPSKDGRCC